MQNKNNKRSVWIKCTWPIAAHQLIPGSVSVGIVLLTLNWIHQRLRDAGPQQCGELIKHCTREQTIACTDERKRDRVILWQHLFAASGRHARSTSRCSSNYSFSSRTNLYGQLNRWILIFLSPAQWDNERRGKNWSMYVNGHDSPYEGKLEFDSPGERISIFYSWLRYLVAIKNLRGKFVRSMDCQKNSWTFTDQFVTN